MIKLFLILFLLFSCICVNTAYAFLPFNFLGAILGPDGRPKWKKLSEHKFKRNIFKIKDGKENIIATGFIINRESKYMITNAHVALLAKGLGFVDELCAENDNGKIKIKNIELVDKELDFALLAFEWINKKKEIADITIYNQDSPSLDNTVYIIGFAPTEKEFVISTGFVTETEYTRERKPCFKYNADTDPGMSGSPVFNSENKLIGLHYGSPEPQRNNAIPFKLISDKYEQKL